MRLKRTNILRLTKIVSKRARERRLFNVQDILLVMFSGGQDSVLCLLILVLLREKAKYTCNRKSLLNSPIQKQIRERIVKQSDKPSHTDTLLWCHHFWQQSSFFTMEHISRVAYCQTYRLHLFAPIKKVLSEQGARHWRHQVMQRSLLNSRSQESDYIFLELYLTSIFIPEALSVTEERTTRLKNTPVNPQLLKDLKAITSKEGTHLFTKHSTQRDAYTTCLQSKALRLVAMRLFWLHSNQNKTKAQRYRSKQLCVQGHTMSDRAESIVLNLIRGTGMNGLSTLQWKHTFSSLTDSTSTNLFYPINSDFFKELRVIRLQSLLQPLNAQLVLQKKLSFCKGIKNANENFDLESNLFNKGSHVKTFYYQLRYMLKNVTALS